ncbi:MAG: PIN domain-containing protein [Actinomycetota bacterium]
MILLDATALVAFLSGEPAADEAEEILRAGEAAIVATNLTEALDILVRVRGLDLDAVEAKLVPVLATSLEVLAVGEAEARRAASIRSEHYHRQRAPLSLADCMLIASAAVHGAAVATSDTLVAEVAAEEGVGVVTMPGTR